MWLDVLKVPNWRFLAELMSEYSEPSSGRQTKLWETNSNFGRNGYKTSANDMWVLLKFPIHIYEWAFSIYKFEKEIRQLDRHKMNDGLGTGWIKRTLVKMHCGPQLNCRKYLTHFKLDICRAYHFCSFWPFLKKLETESCPERAIFLVFGHQMFDCLHWLLIKWVNPLHSKGKFSCQLKLVVYSWSFRFQWVPTTLVGSTIVYNSHTCSRAMWL